MDLIHVRNVGKPSIVPVHYETMKELTLERNSMNVRIVAKPSVVSVLYETMKELMLESSATNVRKWESLQFYHSIFKTW